MAIINLIRKILFLVFFTTCTLSLFAQERAPVKKPEYVIIANDKILSPQDLANIKPESIKGMNKGVSEKEWQALVQKFGDRIGDREFIMTIELYSEQEMKERASAPKMPVEKIKTASELKLQVNDRASDFTVEMIDGKKISLSDLKGKVVLVNYWATWCAPCLMEFAEFPDKLLKPFNGKDFVLIPIAVGETKELVSKKMNDMKKYGVYFNSGFDPEKKIWNDYATGAIPKNFVIDQQGIIRYVSTGNAEGSVDQLANAIKNLLP